MANHRLNRVAFLVDALRDLGEALRERGGALVLRRVDVRTPDDPEPIIGHDAAVARFRGSLA